MFPSEAMLIFSLSSCILSSSSSAAFFHQVSLVYSSDAVLLLIKRTSFTHQVHFPHQMQSLSPSDALYFAFRCSGSLSPGAHLPPAVTLVISRASSEGILRHFLAGRFEAAYDRNKSGKSPLLYHEPKRVGKIGTATGSCSHLHQKGFFDKKKI